MGVLIIALAFAASRAGDSVAGPTYWVGQAVLYAIPAVVLLSSRPVTKREALGIALMIPIASYAVTESYSPLQFLFLDEFAHVRTAQAILTSHHLFSSNPALPISPQYPGLEIITTAVATVAHLSIYASGTVVIGVAHVALCLGIFFLILEVCGRRRVAALAVLVYSVQPHFQFFDSYFIYEVAGLPFVVGALLATVKMLKEPNYGRSTWWAIAAFLCAAVATVTHHVSSYVLLGGMLAIEVGFLLLRRGAWRDWRLPILICFTAELIASWDLDAAPGTIGYFLPTLQSLLSGFGKSRSGISVASPTGPLLDLALEYVGVLLLAALVGAGVWLIWRQRRRSRGSLTISLAIGSLSLFAALALRVVGPEGSELYGRAATYFMIPASFAAAVALRAYGLPSHLTSRWQIFKSRRVTAAANVVVLVLLGLGGVAGGWPPFYARLPGKFEVQAWERSVDQHNLDLATWTATELPADNGFASDFVTASILASLGGQAAPPNVASLFLDSHVSASTIRLVAEQRVTFIAVDLRLAQDVPADGYYFVNDPRQGEYRSPIPLKDLTKFSSIPGVSKVFDDGTIAVYDVVGSVYDPPKAKHK
ncbi:MAG: hypothetical protein ACRENX_06470 [Candidatus Dormibacteria bacterium]